MGVETDIREMKRQLSTLNRKVDLIIESWEASLATLVAERSLKEFLENEPDIYSVKDLKVKYR